MNCVKKYDVGQIKLEPYCISDLDELPLFVYYTHELPLLSFGDVQHTVNLSLVFNYAGYRTEKRDDSHPFFIAPGYKLNLQKHLLYDANGLPTALVEESGKTVGLMQAFGGVFTFDDESQRILRRKERSQKPLLPGGNIDYGAGPLYDYIVEYPDFSKEKYNESGRITAVYDKYSSSAFLTYSYNGYGQLTAITFRGSKTITLDYAANRLKHITYADCSSCFNYNFDGTLNNIEHYTGVKYNFMLSKAGFDFEEDLLESDFTIEAVSVENNTTVSYSKKLKWEDAKTIKVCDNVGNDPVKEVLYKFSHGLTYGDSLQFVDITDNNGVVTRTQLDDPTLLYSYEIQNDEPQFSGDALGNYFAGNVTFYDAVNHKAVCVQTLNTGLPLGYNENNYTWSRGIEEYANEKGYFTVSGWIKTDNSELTDVKIFVEAGMVNTTEGNSVSLRPTGQWKFFSILHNDWVNMVYVRTNCGADILMRDVRITFHGTDGLEDNDVSHAAPTEYFLVDGSNELSFKDLQFYYGVYDHSYEIDDEDVTFADVMRYKLRKKREGLSGEVYYNNGKNAIVGTTDLRVLHDGTYRSISEFDLLVKVYSNLKMSSTKIIVDETNPNTNILKICTVTKKTRDENQEYFVISSLASTEKLDNNLDVVESTVEGVTTKYVRNSQGLITSQIVSGLGTRTTVYDTNDAGEQTVTITDEFNNSIHYTFDNIWGAVKEVCLSDGTIIKNYYDGDMSTLLHKTFSKDNKEKVHHFNYPDEQSLEVSDDTLQYAFENDFLVSGRQYVKKLGVPIEYHERSMNDRTFKDAYPDYLDPEYECSGTFDKYGRLKKIDNILENSYLIDPRWTYLHQNQQTHIMNEYNRVDDGELHHSSAGVDGKDAMLSQTKDLLTEETTKYGYYGGKLTAALTYDNSDSVLSREVFVYDKADRLKEHNFNYNLSNSDPITGNHVGSDIGYVKSDDNPLADNQVANYSYKVGGAEKAKTENTYDAYKRIINKKYTVGGKVFTKGIEYAQTRIGTLVDSVGGTTLYEYDPMGRICQEKDGNGSILKSYTYDEFGQLIREGNKALDKTYVYEYNNIGNVTLVKEYDYYAPDEELPSCQKCAKYEYDSECPDKLTKFDGNVIEYNSIGCTSKYKDENYEWANGKLSKIHRSTVIRDEEYYTTRTFTYDGYGRRTQKHYVTGVKYSGADAVNSYSRSHTNDYTYDNSGRLIRELRTEWDYSGTKKVQELIYLYDESGMIGVMYNSQPYYYHRNLQGDVIAIYDANGEKQVEYAYDAWGNCEIVYGENNELANANPIRYRGYYYDTETGLYYLNARYYSPEWRRFISPDAAEYLDPETPNGLNLYAYCYNDPINYADPSGHDPEWWQWALFGVGAALVAVAAGMAILGTGGVAAFGMGALIGSAVVGGAGAVVGGVVGYATGGVEGILGGVLTGFGIGAIVGFAVGGSIGVGIWNHDVKLARQFLTNNNVDAGFHDDIINSFKYRIKIKSINVDTTVYRYYSDSARRISYWVTPRTYSNPVQKLALAYGNNTAKYLAQLTLTSGARVLTGTVAGAGGLLGGGIQYYVYDLAWILG